VNVREAALSGDRRKILEAVRDQLATELDEGRTAVAVAPIAKQLVDVVRELDSMPGTHKDSKSDELAERRKTRRVAARKSEAAGQ